MTSVTTGRAETDIKTVSPAPAGADIADSHPIASSPKTKAEALDDGLEAVCRNRKTVPIIRPDMYRDTPLVGEIAELCDPDTPVRDIDLTLLTAKYFYAFATPGGHTRAVSLDELSGLFEQFSRHRSLNEPYDDVDCMNRLRKWSFALRMLADLPKTAHILRAVINHRRPEEAGSRFIGLDVGAGTGILMLGQAVQAARNGFETIEIHGLEYDSAVAERADEMVRELGIGQIHQADARNPEAYRPAENKPLTFVTNETIAGMHQCIEREHFTRINTTLFRTLGAGLKNAGFFPEGVIAYARDHDVSVMLTRENGFMGPREYRGRPMTPLGLFIENEIIPMHKLGADFKTHTPGPARKYLQRRW